MWNQDTVYVVSAAIILALQGALITGLLIQRARRRRSELVLRESEERFRTLANSLPVIVWSARPDTTLDFVNSTAGQFTGLSIEQLLDNGWLDHLHPDDVDRCQHIYLPAVEARRPFQMEYRLRRANGGHGWILDTGVPRYEPDGRFAGYIGSSIDITERKEMEQSLIDNQAALRRSFEQNQDLVGRLISAQEEERTRIARDLHDDLSQQLAGLAIVLSGLKRKVGKLGSQPDIDQTVANLQERAVALSETVRNLSHELHPSVLEHGGLVAAIQRHCAEIERHHSLLKVTLSAKDDLESLNPDVALCLFRVTQESLTNALRHAHARTIVVQLMSTNDSVELAIIDDGIGFVASERTSTGLGLRSIDERVRLIRGTVRLESQPGQGTKVLVSVPRAVA